MSMQNTRQSRLGLSGEYAAGPGKKENLYIPRCAVVSKGATISVQK